MSLTINNNQKEEKNTNPNNPLKIKENQNEIINQLNDLFEYVYDSDKVKYLPIIKSKNKINDFIFQINIEKNTSNIIDNLTLIFNTYPHLMNIFKDSLYKILINNYLKGLNNNKALTLLNELTNNIDIGKEVYDYLHDIFNKECLDYEELDKYVRLLSLLSGCNIRVNEPRNYLYFASEKGIISTDIKDYNIKLDDGFTFSLWINIDDYVYSCGKNIRESLLLNIIFNDDNNLSLILKEPFNELLVKGSNDNLYIDKIHIRSNKWTQITLIFNNEKEENNIILNVNDGENNSYKSSNQCNISNLHDIKNMTFFDNFIGRTTSIILFGTPYIFNLPGKLYFDNCLYGIYDISHINKIINYQPNTTVQLNNQIVFTLYPFQYSINNNKLIFSNPYNNIKAELNIDSFCNSIINNTNSYKEIFSTESIKKLLDNENGKKLIDYCNKNNIQKDWIKSNKLPNNDNEGAIYYPDSNAQNELSNEEEEEVHVPNMPLTSKNSKRINFKFGKIDFNLIAKKENTIINDKEDPIESQPLQTTLPSISKKIKKSLLVDTNNDDDSTNNINSIPSNTSNNTNSNQNNNDDYNLITTFPIKKNRSKIIDTINTNTDNNSNQYETNQSADPFPLSLSTKHKSFTFSSNNTILTNPSPSTNNDSLNIDPIFRKSSQPFRNFNYEKLLLIDTDKINKEAQLHEMNFKNKVYLLAKHCIDFIDGIDTINDCEDNKFDKNIHIVSTKNDDKNKYKIDLKPQLSNINEDDNESMFSNRGSTSNNNNKNSFCSSVASNCAYDIGKFGSVCEYKGSDDKGSSCKDGDDFVLEGSGKNGEKFCLNYCEGYK